MPRNYMVHRKGTLISVGTVLGTGLGKDLTVIEVTDAEYLAYVTGHAVWNGHGVDIVEPVRQTTDTERIAALEAVLIDKGIVTKTEVDDKVPTDTKAEEIKA
jgi:hypothetical protein